VAPASPVSALSMNLMEAQANVCESSLISEVALDRLKWVRPAAFVGPDFRAVGQAIHPHLAVPQHIDTNILSH